MNLHLLAIDKDLEQHNYHKIEWENQGINCVRADNMVEAIELLLRENSYNFVIVGINADNIEYLPMLNVLREITNLPIHILKTKYSFEEHLNALDKGADHYGAWLDDANKSTIRGIRMLQRYAERSKDLKIEIDFLLHKGIFVYQSYKKVYFNNDEIILTINEFELLLLFINQPYKVYTNNEIKRFIWGDNYIDNDNVILWNLIKRLKRKIKSATGISYIFNIYDIGYSFDK